MLDAFFASRRHPTGKPSPLATTAPATTSPCSSESLIALYTPTEQGPSKHHTTHRVSVYSPGEARKSLAAYMDSDSYSLMSESDARHPENRQPGSGFLASVWALGTTITVCCVDTSREVVNDVVTLAAGFARERRNYAASVASSAGMDDFLEDPTAKPPHDVDETTRELEVDYPEGEFEIVEIPELENMPVVDTREFSVRYRSRSREDLRELARPVLKKTGSVSSLREAQKEARKEDIKAMLAEAQAIVDALKAAPVLPIEAVSAAPAAELKRQASAETPKLEEAKAQEASDKTSTEELVNVEAPKPAEPMADVIEVDDEDDFLPEPPSKSERRSPAIDVGRPVMVAPAPTSSAVFDDDESMAPSSNKEDDKKDDEKKEEKKPAARMANAFRRRMSVSGAFSPFKKPKDITTAPHVTSPAYELTPPPTPPANIDTSSLHTSGTPTTGTPTKSRVPIFARSRSRRGSVSADSALANLSKDLASEAAPASTTPVIARRPSFVSVASSRLPQPAETPTVDVEPPKRSMMRRPTFSSSKTEGKDRRKSWFIPKASEPESAPATVPGTPVRTPSISDNKPKFFRKPNFGTSSERPTTAGNDLTLEPTLSPGASKPASRPASRPPSISEKPKFFRKPTFGAHKADDSSRPTTAGAESALEAASVAESVPEPPKRHKRRPTMSFGSASTSAVPNVAEKKMSDAAAKMKGFVRASSFMGRTKKDKERRDAKGKGVAVDEPIAPASTPAAV